MEKETNQNPEQNTERIPKHHEWQWPLIAIIVLIAIGVSVWYVIQLSGENQKLSAEPQLYEASWPVSFDASLLLLGVDNEGNLLIKRTDQPTIYKYNHSSKEFLSSKEPLWDGAVAITDCELQFDPELSIKVYIDIREDKALFDGKEFSTAGKIPISRHVGPSGKYFSVLSASGRRKGSIGFIGGGQNASGQHYHQVFDRLGNMVGVPVPIPLESKDVFIGACWSPDERFVIYQQYLKDFVIVPVELDES